MAKSKIIVLDYNKNTCKDQFLVFDHAAPGTYQHLTAHLLCMGNSVLKKCVESLLIVNKVQKDTKKRVKGRMCSLKFSFCFRCYNLISLLLLLLLPGGISGNQNPSFLFLSLTLFLFLSLSLSLSHSALLKENRHYDISPAKHSKKSQERGRERERQKRQSKRESEVKIV